MIKEFLKRLWFWIRRKPHKPRAYEIRYCSGCGSNWKHEIKVDLSQYRSDYPE
jgi:hypothetical protein